MQISTVDLMADGAFLNAVRTVIGRYHFVTRRVVSLTQYVYPVPVTGRKVPHRIRNAVRVAQSQMTNRAIGVNSCERKYSVSVVASIRWTILKLRSIAGREWSDVGFRSLLRFD
jgi:hypothetical protein